MTGVKGRLERLAAGLARASANPAGKLPRLHPPQPSPTPSTPTLSSTHRLRRRPLVGGRPQLGGRVRKEADAARARAALGTQPGAVAGRMQVALVHAVGVRAGRALKVGVGKACLVRPGRAAPAWPPACPQCPRPNLNPNFPLPLPHQQANAPLVVRARFRQVAVGARVTAARVFVRVRVWARVPRVRRLEHARRDLKNARMGPGWESAEGRLEGRGGGAGGEGAPPHAGPACRRAAGMSPTLAPPPPSTPPIPPIPDLEAVHDVVGVGCQARGGGGGDGSVWRRLVGGRSGGGGASGGATAPTLPRTPTGQATRQFNPLPAAMAGAA